MYRVPRKLKKMYKKDGFDICVTPASGNIHIRDQYAPNARWIRITERWGK